VDQFSGVTSQASFLKQELVALGEEDAANRMLCVEFILTSFLHELQMWIALKDDGDAGKAWDALIDAQMAVLCATRTHEVPAPLASRLSKLEILEKLLFPPLTFVSAGFVCKKSSCSICGQEYGSCDHLQGRPYMGELCAKVIEEIGDSGFTHVALMEQPADKRCRVLTFTDQGVTRDVLTWKEVESDKSRSSTHAQSTVRILSPTR